MTKFIESPLPSHYEMIVGQLKTMGIEPFDVEEHDNGYTEFCFDRNDWLSFTEDLETNEPIAYDSIANECAYLPVWETCDSCGKDVSYNYMIFRTELLEEFVKAVTPDVYKQWAVAFSQTGGEA